jgi:hypothetical protein
MKRKVERKYCDIEDCEHEAKHECANCGADLCDVDEGHTHSFGDGGHLEHAIRMHALPWSYGGRVEFYLCPRCYTTPLTKPLSAIIEDKGEAIEYEGNPG